MKRLQKFKKQKLSKKVLISALILIIVGSFIVPFSFYNNKTAKAATIDDLRTQSNELQRQIEEGNQQAKNFADQAATIQERVAQLQFEINQANKQIELTTLKIQELDLRLQQAQKDLDHQKSLLKASLQALYKKGGASTVELLVGSDSFSQFINDQTYLERLKASIQTSTEKVIELKQQIQAQQDEQKKLLSQQESQKISLEDTKAQQANLLATTMGEQAKYEQIVAELQAKQQAVDDELTALIRAGNMVSLGRVHRGDLIGYVGMTGFTFGPHLHFEVRDGNNNTVNPLPLENYDFTWPVDAAHNINQYYGCGAPYWWYVRKCGDGTSFHAGVDVDGYLGAYVLAAGDGDIIVNSDQGDGYGHKIIIRQDNGYYTYYGHLQY